MQASDRQLVRTFAAILDALPIAAFLTNAAGDVRLLNRAWYRLTGIDRPRDSDEARAYDERVDLAMHPDDVESVLPQWRRSCAAGRRFRDRVRLRAASGAYRWVVAQANPMVEMGRVAGFVGTLTDVDRMYASLASLAASEERFRMTGEALPGLLWSARADGSFVRSFEGRTSASSLSQTHAWRDGSVHPDDRQRTTDRWTSSVRSGTPFESEFRMQAADGDYRWFLSRASAQRDDAGAIFRWVGVSIDVDQRVRLQEQLRQFAAEAGHELRTPLTVISGYLDVLRRGGLDDGEIRAAALASLVVETKRMRRLVERLMTLDRLENARAAEPEAMDVGPVLRQAVDARRVVTRTPIVLDVPERIRIFGEPSDLNEVVANLLENAVKYGARTVVSISASRARDTVTIRVEDGGPGIPVVHRSRIFDRFYRGVENGEIAGSGLGLAIAARAAVRLGGRLELEDARPGSTTFALIVPALV